MKSPSMSTSLTFIFYLASSLEILSLCLGSIKTRFIYICCSFRLYTFGKSLSKKLEPIFLSFSMSFRSSFHVRWVKLLLRFQSLLKCSMRNLQNSVQVFADIAIVETSRFFRVYKVLIRFLRSSKAFLSFIPRFPPILRFIKVF